MKWIKRVLLVMLILAPVSSILWLRLYYGVMLVPTASMTDGILVGDHVIVRLLRNTTPRRGDVLIFSVPPTYTLKRVVAVPGDRVSVHEKTLYLNGQKQHEKYVKHIDPLFAPYRDEFPGHPPGSELVRDRAWAAFVESSIAAGEVVVPSGKCFVLGDNRDNSFDSRYMGFLGNDQIFGRPLMVLFSVETDTDHVFDRKRWGGFRGERFLKWLEPKK